MNNPNFPTGTAGLIAVDKVAGTVLFLDPATYETTKVLDGFAPRPHELAISPDHQLAYVPIYGDGIHGKNPHPGHLIAVIDLATRLHVGDLSTAPYLAPHGLQWDPHGVLYCVCENSGVVLALDPEQRKTLAIIEVGSNKTHRAVITPDGAKLYTENEEDAFASVLDLAAGRVVAELPAPNGLAGIGISPDGATVVLVDAREPELLVVDTATDQVTRRVRLDGHERAAQIARYSPDGRYLVVTSYDAPLATVFDAGPGGAPGRQRLLRLGRGPMNMAFHPDGRTAVIANHDEGTLAVVDLGAGRVRRTVAAGAGVETLAFF